jgi:hypothetical protein
MIPMEIPERPWSKIAADLFELNKKHYLLIVDYFSKWPEVISMSSLNSKQVIDLMKSQIARYGIPDELITDNGPQFASAEFARFMEDYEIKHTTTSPRYPQANGQAERMVQTVKNLLTKAKDPYKALLDYRNTPLDTGKSPAELFLGRKLKSTLPAREELLKPGKGHSKKNHKQMTQRQKKQKEFFDRKASDTLSKFKAGDAVMMQFGDKWKKAEIVKEHETPRSYIVKDEENVHYRRNRKMLRPTKVAHQDNANRPSSTDHLKSQAERVKDNNDQNPAHQETMKNNGESNDNAVRTRSGRISKPPVKYDDEY